MGTIPEVDSTEKKEMPIAWEVEVTPKGVRVRGGTQNFLYYNGRPLNEDAELSVQRSKNYPYANARIILEEKGRSAVIGNVNTLYNPDRIISNLSHTLEQASQSGLFIKTKKVSNKRAQILVDRAYDLVELMKYTTRF